MQRNSTKLGIIFWGLTALTLVGVTNCQSQNPKKEARQAARQGNLPLAEKGRKGAGKARANMTRAAIMQVEALASDLRDPQTKALATAIAKALRALDIKLSYIQKKSMRRGRHKNQDKKAERQEKRAERRGGRDAEA